MLVAFAALPAGGGLQLGACIDIVTFTAAAMQSNDAVWPVLLLLSKHLLVDQPTTLRTTCCLTVLLEKFKDKAAVVTRAAAEALDMMHLYSFALPDVAEDVTAALAHQNPKVKESTGTWLASCTKRETKANVLKLLPAVVPAAVKCTDEGAPAIREAAFSFLVQAALKVRQGDQLMVESKPAHISAARV